MNKEMKLNYEKLLSKNGKEYYRLYTLVNGLKIYLQFTDYTSKRLFEESLDYNKNYEKED